MLFNYLVKNVGRVAGEINLSGEKELNKYTLDGHLIFCAHSFAGIIQRGWSHAVVITKKASQHET